MKHHLQTAILFPLAIVLAFGVVACEDDANDPGEAKTTFSAAQDVGDGSAKLFVTQDADGNPTAMGFRISEDALNGLDTATKVHEFTMISEGSATPFKYVTLDWNPHGHAPTMIFDVPHFDMHFYTMTKSDLMTSASPVDSVQFHTRSNNLPGAEYVPANYFHPAPPGSAEAVPFMGVHWLDSTDALAPGTFTEVMIYGSWNGKIHFVEPMMTTAWLKTKPTLNETIKQPAKWSTSGYWPTTYSVSFDEATKEYVITLGGMTMRTAS